MYICDRDTILTNVLKGGGREGGCQLATGSVERGIAD